MNILLVGAGRMGLSHLAILKSMLPNDSSVTIVDPSFSNRTLFRYLVKGRVTAVSDISRVRVNSHTLFDVALVTTPPTVRASIVDKVRACSKKIFIEKPVLVPLSGNAMSGYVLQHCPMNIVAQENIPRAGLVRVSATLETNLKFGEAASNWRSGKFGSVTYEFGGHLLSLIGSSAGFSMFTDEKNIGSKCEVETCEPNLARFVCHGPQGLPIECELVAGSKRVRKARYEVRFQYSDHELIYDIYSLQRRCLKTDQVVLLDNIASRGLACDFYLRGFEFTRQMQALINGNFDILSSVQIQNIEEIVEYVSQA